MFKQVATILNRLVAYLFTAPSSETVIKPSNTASNSLAQYGQPCRDVLTPAKQKPKRKRSVAQSTKQVASRKQTQKPAQQEHGQGGSQQAIPASKLPLPVKPAVKRKPKAVPSTKAALLSVPGLAVVLTPTVVQSGEAGKRKTTASKTRQPVVQAPTKKRKAAVSTTAVKKTTKSKTPVQTRTARPSKAGGR